MLKRLQTVEKEFGTARNKAEQFAAATKDVGKAAEQAGKGAEKGAIGLSKFGSSVMRIVKYRAIRAIIRSIMSAFSEGLTNVREYSAGLEGEGKRIAEAFDNLSMHSLTMKNQIGSAFAEILTSLMPIIEQLVSLLTRAANVISQFFAALSGYSKYYKAVDATEQVAKNLGSGAKSAKEIRNQLMGFDVINRLDQPNEPSGGGSGGNANNANNMFEYTEIEKRIKDSIAAIELALGASLLALGAILTFSGANIPLGLGLMAAGGFLLAKSLSADWNSVPPKIQSALTEILLAVGAALIAIGTIFLFAGHIGLGLGMILAGGISVASVAVVWGKLSAEVQQELTLIAGIAGAALIALGVVFLLAGAVPLGLGMILAGGALGVTALALNWDGLKKKLSDTWDGIKKWYNDNVAEYLTLEFWQKKIDEICNVEWHIRTPIFNWSFQPVESFAQTILTALGLPGLLPVLRIIPSFATGGFPEDGLFAANHGELVGQFSNGRTAVANNEQIIEGIRRGVYEAVSSAMSNNSGENVTKVYLDGKVIANAVTRNQRSMERSTGVSFA